MKMYVICDNTDTLTGMRLAGVEGKVVHDRAGVIETIKETTARDDVSVVLITSVLKGLCNDYLSDFMKKHPEPLFLEIPDRHGAGREHGSIAKFIESSIGLKL